MDVPVVIVPAPVALATAGLAQAIGLEAVIGPEPKAAIGREPKAVIAPARRAAAKRRM
jgi:hypothetical protein